MKKKILFKLILTLLFLSVVSNAQVAVPFSPRLTGNFLKLKGDATLIGNTIVNVAPANNPTQANNPYNGSNNNNGQNMEYVNIDGAGNPTLFSSSSARLTLPTSCSRVAYAGLYWFAVYPNNRSTTSTSNNDYVGTVRTEDWFNMKFKVPGGSYIDITADNAADPTGSEDAIIFNGYNSSNISQSFNGSPYVCYKNVTSIVQAATNPNGDYFGANIRATRGPRASGCSGGWMLVVVYEDSTLTSKYFSTFDGYVSVNGNTTLSYSVNGFNTIPTGPVKAKIGVAALEGDYGITGDKFSIKANSLGAFTVLSDAANPNNNYFNSTVSSLGVIMPNRNPASTNTLGTDIDLINLNNPINSVLPNGETGANLRLSTTGDAYGALFSLFAVDIIEPNIPIVKIAENLSGTNINGQSLAIGQTFYYSLNFDNNGNDNAQSFTIEDTLPVNIVFPAAGNGTPILASDLILPPGVTYTFNPVTRKFVFTIPNNLVTTAAPGYSIKIKVRSPQTCAEVQDACSNVVINQAYATYTGITSGISTTQSPSNSGYDTCNNLTPGATNYLVNIDLCTFTNTAVLCGSTVVLTAANGYTTYQWYDSNNNPLGNTQSITVSSIGTYHVVTNAPNPCASITQTFNVVNFSNAITVNPVIPFADQVVVCPNNGVQLPKIFLCGTGSTRLIQTGITDATSIIWQKLNTASCPAVTIANCPNTGTTCTWNQVGTGANYTANTAGEFRIIINYQNGCFRIFYFNVYLNLLNPTITPKNIVCTTQGNITITNISTGYEFSLSPTGPFQSSNVIPITTAGTYTVYIRQIGVTNGCLFTFPNISVLSQPFTVNIIKTDKLCNSSYGSINVQINGVNPQYNYQLSQGSTVVSTFGPSATNFHVFSNLNPGTYTVTSTTTDGCTNTQQITIADLSNLALNATVSQNISCTQGNIQVNPTGGQPPYNYAIYSYNGVPVTPANYNFQTSVIFDVFQGQEGFYQFIVVDSNNCTSISNTVEIVLEPAVTTTEAHTNVTCNGLANGTITITAAPTNGYNVTYSLDGITFQSSNVFSNLAPGTYTITVKYKKGNRECTYPITVTITQPTILQAQSQLTQQLTCIATGTIQASASGGTSPYQYSINGVTFQSSNTFTGLTAGAYTITVKDANNCTVQTTSINIPVVLSPTDLTFSNTNITCPNLTSNLTATVVGGNSPFTFQIISPSTINASSTTGSVATFNNLTAGTYTIKVTDSKGCAYQENYTINPITPISVNGSVTSNVKCFGGNTGAVAFNVSGFTGTYSYSVNSGTAVTNQTATTIPLTGLTIGNYSITVTDSVTNCQSTFSLTVTGPASALALSATPSQPTCVATGSVNATATGGWGSYQYTLTLPNATTTASQNSGLFTNLTAVGTYTVTATDANGCIITKTFTINSFTNPTLVISSSSILCYNTTTGSTIVVNASSGTPPYQYQINSGALQNSNTFSNLSPGSYTIQVKDSYGCTASVTQVINPLLVATAAITKNLDCTTSPNATVNVAISGGVSPYQYQVKFNGGAWSAITAVTGASFVYSTANPGTYQFQITDSKGCVTTTNVVTVAPLVQPVITSVTQSQSILCNGDSNGAFTINYNNTVGLAPFAITVLNTTSGVNFGTQTTGLPVGNYLITLTDANSCSDTETIILTQPAVLAAQAVITQQITCLVNGTIQANNLTGGTSPYQYSLNGVAYQSSNTFSNLAAGTYTITVKDANNCIVQTNAVTLTTPAPITDLSFTSTAVICPALNSNVTVTSTGGVAPFTFQIISPSTINASSTTANVATFNALNPGTYIFKVNDSNGCTYQENFTINPPTMIAVNGSTVSNVSCLGDANGVVSFTVSGFSTSYSYTVNSGTPVTNQTNASVTLNSLAAGIYIINVTDTTTHCQANVTLTVTSPAIALGLTKVVSPITCVANGNVVGTATGGWGSYQYTLTLPNASNLGPQISGSFGNLTLTGNYTLSVIDGNNCIATTTFTLTPTVNPVLAVDPSSALCYNTVTGSTVVLAITGGVAPYSYNANGGTNQASNTFTNITPGTYTFNVVDSYGCTASVNQVINPLLVATAAITKNLDCTTSPNATVNVAISGGVSPYQYQVKFNGGAWSAITAVTGASFVYSTANPGTYQFQITDSKGCVTTTNVVTVAPLVQPVITSVTQSQSILCNGDSNGAFTINYNNTVGLAPFAITVLNTTSGVNFGTQTTGLPVGNYLITLTDANSCSDTETIILTQPAVLAAQAVITQQITCLINGTIQANNLTGGTSPYQYSLNGVAYQSSNTFSNLAAGTYTITVKDANNCIVQTNAVTLTTPAPITDLSFTSTAVICPALNSNVTVTSTGGVAPFTFQIISPSTINASSTTANVATFNALNPGTYIFKVTDSNGCTYQENFTINPPTMIAVNGSTVSNVSCLGDANGVVSFTVSGFSTSYSYTVNSGTPVTNQTNASVTLNSLAAGNYIINVTDTTTHCQANVTLTVTSPAIALGLTKVVSPITCVANGNVVGTATGGWGSYQYTLTLPNASNLGPQISGSFGNLTLTGNYTLSVIDGNNCIATTTFNLTPTVNPVLAIDPSSALCYNTATGSTVVLAITGGVAPYSYNANGGTNQASNTFTNITPGTYTFNVVDSYGCTASVTQVINPLLVATAAITKNLDCTTSPNATVNVTISGGVSPYQYQVKFNGGAWSAITAVTGASFVYSTANPGNYQFQITDSEGCVTTTNVVTIIPITSPDIVSLTQTLSNLCNGDSNAAFTINMNPSLGVGPFVFTVINTTTGINYGAQTSGLPAGNYTVSVVDANQCTDTTSITITQPNPIAFTVNTTDISCTGTGGTNFGEIKVVSVSGGTMPYTYHISNNFGYTDTYNSVTNEDHTFIVLNFGVYHVQVTDANGCVLVGSDIIIASPPNDLDIDVSTPTVSCLTGGTAIITVSTAVMSGSYEFGILTSNSSPYATVFQPADAGTPETTTFTGLTPGVLYTFVVHDLITNCYYFETAASPILSPSSITANINAVNNVTCTGSSNGTVSFTITGYDATATSISYEIFNAQSNSTTGFTGNSLNTGSSITVNSFATLSPGLYYLLVTENGGANTGCTAATTPFSITQSVTLLNANASLIKNDNCNLNAGIVSASAVGGTAPYQYQILASTATAPTISTWTGSSTNNFNVESGNYIVYVKDTNNCIQSASITVGLDLAPTIALSLPLPCANEGAYAIQVVRSNGIAPFTYSVDSGATFTENNASFSIPNLSSGVHTVVVTDANGCSDTQTITILAKVTGNAAAVQQPSCANNDGVIQANAASGGGIPYFFTLQDNLGNPLATNATGLFSGLGFGNYTIIITDPLTCSVSVAASLEQPAPVTFTNSFVNPTCNGLNNGSITLALDATDINPPYLYSLDNGVTTQSSPIFNNLLAGSYTVTVISGRNCRSSQIVNIIDPIVLDVTATATTFACNSANTVNTVTITATPTGGTSPYLFSIDGTNYQAATTFSLADNGAVQNLTVHVKDANSCTDTFPISINPLPVMTNPLVTQNTAITCTNNESVTVTVSGGSGNFNYQLLPSGTPSTTNTFTLTTSGSYVFQITDTTTGCTINTNPYNINALPNATATATVISNVDCFGNTTGSMQLSVNGYTGSYSYDVYQQNGTLLSSGTSASTIVSSLAAGSYYFTVTETQAPFCNTTSNVVTIGTPSQALAVSLQQTNDVNCRATNSGTITATATSGTAPYQYQLMSGATILQAYAAANVFNTLDTGSYTVNVKDTNNCIQSASITVGLDLAPTIALSLPLPCANEGAYAIQVVRSNGIAPFTYSVDSGATFTENNASFSIPNLSSGVHTVVVTDANGCSDTQTITILAKVTGNAAAVQQPSCANNDGVIQANAASGGGIPYFFTLQDNLGNPLATNATGLFSGLGFGNYTIIITDPLTCSVSVAASLEQPAPVTFTNSFVNPTCNGLNNGSITLALDATDINPPYLYSLDNGVTTQSSPIFNNLLAGSYTVTVISGRNCRSSQIVNIIDPIVLDVTATATTFACNSANTVNTVTITATPTGGTSPYLFSIDGTNYQAATTFSLADNGAVQNLTVHVKDANSCTDTFPISINPLPVMTNPLVTQNTAITCTNNESVTVTVSGGSGNFNYQLLPSGTPSTTNTFTLTTSGSYVFQITDTTTGCTINTNPYNINALPNATATATVISNVDCFGNTTGSMQLNVTGYTGSYSYDVYQQNGTLLSSGTSASTIVSALAAGSYYFTVTETQAPFCNTTSNVVTIGTPSQALAVSLQQTNDVNCRATNSGTITATATGGTAPYQYQLMSGATILQAYAAANVFTTLDTGSYTVNVKDTNNCIQSASITVGLDLAPTIALSLPLPCANEGAYAIQVVRSNGIAPFTYSVDSGATFTENNASFSIPNLSSGVHTVVVTDANGCSDTQTITILAKVTGNAAAVQQPSCANNDGVIQANAASGGGTPYTFTLQDNLGNPLATNATGLFSGLGFGNYTIIITDPLTCSVSVSASLEQPAPVTFTNSFVNPTCNGLNNGSITLALDATDINPPYLYSLDNGVTTQSSPIFNNLLAGSYTVTVISGRNCRSSQIVNIIDPIVLDVTATATTFACNSANTVNTVTITATPTGGTSPYLFSIDGTNYQSATTFSVTDNGLVQNLTIHVKDANSCTDTFPISINPLPVMTNPLVTQNTAITCTNNESVTVTVSGGSGNFNYQLLPSGTPSTTNTFTLTTSGSYVFQITDTTTGCTINTNPYNINALPILQIQANASSAVNCFGDTNGSLSFSVLNYTGNYNYQVIDTLTGLAVANGSGSTLTSLVTVSGLPAGNFNVVLTETQVPLCTATSNVITIGSPAIPVSLTIQETSPVTCTNNQGTITAQTIGGNGNYQYQLINTTTGTTIQAYNSNATFSGLPAGNYQVTVRDQNLCTDVKLITLSLPIPISATNAVSNNPLLCYNATTAFVTVTASGGQGVYQYTLNYPNGTTAGPQTSNVFTNLGAGANYTVTVTDGWNCTFTTLPFTITQPTQIVASLAQQSPLTCLTSAQLLITVSGGTPPYKYSTDGINFVPLTAAPILVGAGTYNYYVTDSKNCTSILTNDIFIGPIPL